MDQTIKPRKKIGLVAHENKKPDLAELARYNQRILVAHDHVQAEAALRDLATTHPYDAHIEGDIALRSNPLEIAGELRQEIQDRLEKAGVAVIEARISHLAYAPEIANAMLRRQQANAVIAARTRIVEGAVGMVEMALDQLSARAS